VLPPEDGHELWLRYRSLPVAARNALRRLLRTLKLQDHTVTLLAAQSEP
jgi:alpha-glucuronidase